jgi:heme exporter protein C
MGGPTIDRSMLWPLLYVAIGLTLLMLALHLAAMRNEILRRRVRTLGLIAASTESRGPSA